MQKCSNVLHAQIEPVIAHAVSLPADAQLSQVNITTQDASPCSAGQVQYAPPPAVGPCYACSTGTQNPAPGATC
jgi:hypothetical protein